MAEADAALRLVDVPDIKLDYAVYHFEAAPMRGVSLLSTGESVDSALIEGVFAERMDFYGLCTGVAAREACVAALGEPDESRVVETADAYSRLPAGETLCWRNETRALELHFVDGCAQQRDAAGAVRTVPPPFRPFGFRGCRAKAGFAWPPAAAGRRAWDAVPVAPRTVRSTARSARPLMLRFGWDFCGRFSERRAAGGGRVSPAPALPLPFLGPYVILQ